VKNTYKRFIAYALCVLMAFSTITPISATDNFSVVDEIEVHIEEPEHEISEKDDTSEEEECEDEIPQDEYYYEEFPGLQAFTEFLEPFCIDYFFDESSRLISENWCDNFFGYIEYTTGQPYMMIDDVQVPFEDAPFHVQSALSFNTFDADAKHDLGLEAEWQEGQLVITSRFQMRRLIVKSYFDACFEFSGATDVVRGPDYMTVLQFATLEEARDTYELLSGACGVEWVEPDMYVSAVLMEFDDEIAEPQSGEFLSWGVERISADLYASYLLGSPERVYVAVLDTGVESHHPFLASRMEPGRCFIRNDDNPYDRHGHGTHVAGTVVDATPGLENIRIVPVKVLSNAGSGSILGIANGVRWSAHNSDVINMSLGGSTGGSINQQMYEAVMYAVGHNTTVVVAAGNSSADARNFTPAQIPAAITVSAFDINDRPASFTNFGAIVDVGAPGVNILSSVPGGGYRSFNGTSMASPHVAALAAMYLLNDSSLTPAAVQAALREYVDTPDGFNRRYGTGLVNMYHAPTGPRPIITLTPSSPNFQNVVADYAPVNEIVITVRSAGEVPVVLNALPDIPNWTLTAGANWSAPADYGETRTFTIRPNDGLPEGTYAPSIRISGEGVGVTRGAGAFLHPTFNVMPPQGVVLGAVSADSWGISGANVALINMETGERRNTVTVQNGAYRFDDVPDGIYRLVFTANGRNAVISAAHEKFGHGLTVNEANFVSGNNQRVLFARLTGVPTQHPANANLTLTFSSRVRNLTAPTENHFWHIRGNTENNERGGLGNLIVSVPGFSLEQRIITLEDYENNLAVLTINVRDQRPERNEINGTVRPSATGAGVAGVQAALVNFTTGEVRFTVTDPEGFYRFSNVANGRYRLYFTMAGRNARVSDLITMTGEGQISNITNFTTGTTAQRVTVVRLIGANGENLSATNVTLAPVAGTATPRALTSSVDENSFWHLISSAANSLAGGIGVLNAFSGEFASVSTPLTAENYLNLFAFVTMSLGDISASPTSTNFGVHMMQALSPPSQIISVRNNRDTEVTFNALPEIPGWILSPNTGWTVPTGSGVSRSFTIQPNIAELGIGRHAPEIRITGSGGAVVTILPTVEVVQDIPATVSGRVHASPAPGEPGISNVQVTLVNMHTGERRGMVTGSQGEYLFSYVEDGVYRVVFTSTATGTAARDARISAPFTMTGNAHVINEVNFSLGTNSRVLLVRLTGVPNQNPNGTRLVLGTRELTPPSLNTDDGFWHIFGTTASNASPGVIGTVTASSPDFIPASASVSAANYVNNVAVVTINMNAGFISPQSNPDFGTLSLGLIPPPQTVTITNNRTVPVSLNPLPRVSGWIISPGTGWNLPVPPGGTRQFTVRPNTGVLGVGAHYPAISVTGSGGASTIVRPVVNVFQGTSGTVHGFVQASPAGAGISGAHVTLLNMDTGSRTNTTTNANGFYSFAGVANGTYRLVFTASGRNARVSDAIIMDDNIVNVNESNSTTGNEPRVLFVRLTGMPSQNPPGTTVSFVGAREFIAPELNSTDGFWNIFGTTLTNATTGVIGTVSVSSPGFVATTVAVAAANYENNVGVITINMADLSMPAGTITGRVSATVGGEGISGAHVSLFNEATGQIREVVMTNTNGDYQFVNVPNGSYRVVFTMSGRNSRHSRVVVNNNSHNVNLSDFATGTSHRLIMVHVTGLPDEFLPETSVLIGNDEVIQNAVTMNLFTRQRSTANSVAGGIGTVTVRVPGFYDYTRAVTASDYENLISIVNVDMSENKITPGTISGSVRQTATGAFVSNVNVTLVNVETFERLHTTTNVSGEYIFENVPNGTYIPVFTLAGRNARRGTPVVVNNNGHVRNRTDFSTSAAAGNRVILARVEGFPDNATPLPSVSITDGTATNALVNIAGTNVWEIFRSTTDNLAGGIGRINTTLQFFQPDYADIFSGEVYENNIVLIDLLLTANYGIDVSPAALSFGRIAEGTQPAPQTVTVTNTGMGNVLLNTLPDVPGWVLVQGELWGLTFAPGESRTFTISPDPNLTRGTHSPEIIITGGNGTRAVIQPNVFVAEPPLLLTAGRANSLRGHIARIPINAAYNPGMTELSFRLEYDDTLLTLIGYDIGNVFAANEGEGNEFIFTADENVHTNGTLLTAIFDVQRGIPFEEIPVRIVNVNAKNSADEEVFIENENGSVNPVFIPGDVNEDGVVDATDLLMLRQFLAGHFVYNPIEGPMRSSEAADINKDGTVDDQDDRLLTEILAGLAEQPITFTSAQNFGDSSVKLSVGRVPALRGNFVEVPINIVTNEGFWSIGFSVNYEPGLIEWESLTNQLPNDVEIFPGHVSPGSRFFLITGYNLEANIENEGYTIMTLGFNVLDDADLGTAHISLGNNAFASNVSYMMSSVESEAGYVLIRNENFIVGDLLGTGRVTSAEATALAVYLLSENKSNPIADINCDGDIDISDLIRLSRRLVGIYSTLCPHGGCSRCGYNTR